MKIRSVQATEARINAPSTSTRSRGFHLTRNGCKRDTGAENQSQETESGAQGMNRRHLVVVIILFFLLAAIPANAYGDPSGGTLFQVLMPALAGFWAVWMI